MFSVCGSHICAPRDMNSFIPKKALGLSWYCTCASPKFRSSSSFLSAIWIWKQMRFASMFLRCQRSSIQLKVVHATTLVETVPAGFSLEPSQLDRLYAHPWKQNMWFSATLLLPITTHTKPRHMVIISYSTAWWGVPWSFFCLLGARLCLLGDAQASAVGYFRVKASSLEALPFGRKCLNIYCVSKKVRVTVYPGD